MPPRRPPPSLICGVILAAALSGCGGARVASVHTTTVARSSAVAAAATSAGATAAPTVRTICTAVAQTVLMRRLGARPVVRPSMANTGYPQCAMSVRTRRWGTVGVVAEVDTETSAYAVLERTIDEASQSWPARLAPAPVHVDRLGLDASWFPAQQHILTTDAVRLVTVGVSWRHVGQGRKVALVAAVARTYLGRLEPQLARGPAP